MRTFGVAFAFLATACSGGSDAAIEDAHVPTSTTCPGAPPPLSGTLRGDDEGPCDLVDGTMCTWSSSCPPGMSGGGGLTLRCSGGRWRFESGGGSCTPDPRDSGVDFGPPPDSGSPDAAGADTPADTKATDSAGDAVADSTLDAAEGG